jgi:hypothetical protein
LAKLEPARHDTSKNNLTDFLWTYTILLYNKGVMLLLKNLLMTIAAILALGFVLYLIPISAEFNW